MVGASTVSIFGSITRDFRRSTVERAAIASSRNALGSLEPSSSLAAAVSSVIAVAVQPGRLEDRASRARSSRA